MSLSTGLDTEITGDEKEKLRRVPSRGCLTTNVDMLTLKVRSVSQDVSSNAFARLTTGVLVTLLTWVTSKMMKERRKTRLLSSIC